MFYVPFIESDDAIIWTGKRQPDFSTAKLMADNERYDYCKQFEREGHAVPLSVAVLCVTLMLDNYYEFRLWREGKFVIKGKGTRNHCALDEVVRL